LDALEALKALGYTERDAREALKKALGESTEEKIKSALKNLNF
jgi:Holliday junction resolvasome RuvABC DNA-binding subunit